MRIRVHIAGFAQTGIGEGRIVHTGSNLTCFQILGGLTVHNRKHDVDTVALFDFRHLTACGVGNGIRHQMGRNRFDAFIDVIIAVSIAAASAAFATVCFLSRFRSLRRRGRRGLLAAFLPFRKSRHAQQYGKASHRSKQPAQSFHPFVHASILLTLHCVLS